jgi:hypothetical protein
MSKFNKKSYGKLLDQVNAFDISKKLPPDWIKFAEPIPLRHAVPEFQKFCNRKGITDDDLKNIYK